MKRRPILFAIVAVAILALGVAWEVASPWWTLKNMEDAARARDGERLASYVDFPRVRESLHEQLTNRVENGLPSPILHAFVKKRAGVIANRITDFIVSPESLRIALDVAPKSERSIGSAKRKCGMKREGLEHFRMRCAPLPIGPAELEFERRGFGWRLVGIDLSDDHGATIP